MNLIIMYTKFRRPGAFNVRFIYYSGEFVYFLRSHYHGYDQAPKFNVAYYSDKNKIVNDSMLFDKKNWSVV